MDYILISAKSLTEAQKIQKILERQRVPCHIQRSRGANGCSFALRIQKEHKELVRSILRSAGILGSRTFSEEEGADHDLFR